MTRPIDAWGDDADWDYDLIVALCVSCGQIDRVEAMVEHVDDGTWCCPTCLDLA